VINRIRYIWQLLVCASLLAVAGILVIPDMETGLDLVQYLVTLTGITLINLTAWLVMVRGIRKSNREGVVVLLAGIGLKFLLYLLYLLVFWMVTKKLTKPFILTFFALYLGFTFLLAIHLFKVLNNK
jgi:hypothetical protein